MQTYFAQGKGKFGFVSGYLCSIIYFVCLQHDDAAKRCRDLSQELVNLRGELGKWGPQDHTFLLFSSHCVYSLQ